MEVGYHMLVHIAWAVLEVVYPIENPSYFGFLSFLRFVSHKFLAWFD